VRPAWTPPQRRYAAESHHWWNFACGGAVALAAVLAATWWALHAGIPPWQLPAFTFAAGAVAGVVALAHTAYPPVAGYAVLCTLAASAWEAAAEARAWATIWSLNAFTALLTAAAGAVVGGALVYGRYRAHVLAAQARLQPINDLSEWARLFARLGLPGVTATDAEETANGLAVKLRHPPTVTWSDLTSAKITEGIEVAKGLHRGAGVRWEPDRKAGFVTLILNERDVLADVIPFPSGDCGPLTVNKPLSVGDREDGKPAAVLLREINVLIVGAAGAGKSGLLNVLIARLGQCVDAVIWMIDLKGGRLGIPWIAPWARGEAPAPVIDWLAIDRAESVLLLRAAHKIIETRSGARRGGSKVKPTPRFPQLVLVCDEIADLISATRPKRLPWEDQSDAEARVTNGVLQWLATEIVRKQRSEAVPMVLATQRGTSSMTGSVDLKSQCHLRFGMGVNDAGEAFYVTGGLAARLQNALYHPGSAVVQFKKGAPVVIKVYQLDHDDPGCEAVCTDTCRIRRHAIAVARLRPVLDNDAASAADTVPDRQDADDADPAYTTRWQRAGGLLTAIREGIATVTPITGDAEFDAVIERTGQGDPERSIPPARLRMLHHLKLAGPVGLPVGMIIGKLERDRREGKILETPHRRTVHRWLNEEEQAGIVAHRGSMWRLRPGEDAATGTG
jgi:hypothetical protein